MKAEEKTVLADFLNLAGGFLGSGYARNVSVVFKDDPAPRETAEQTAEPADTALHSLPLAYLVDENEPPEADKTGRNPLVMVIGTAIDQAKMQYLDRILASAGLFREKNCLVLEENEPYDPLILLQQIKTIRPKAILCLGKSSIRPVSIADNIPWIATYHPDETELNDSLKRAIFEDMKVLMLELAGLDREYAEETKNLIKKYAATDREFAVRAQRFLV